MKKKKRKEKGQKEGKEKKREREELVNIAAIVKLELLIFLSQRNNKTHTFLFDFSSVLCLDSISFSLLSSLSSTTLLLNTFSVSPLLLKIHAKQLNY